MLASRSRAFAPATPRRAAIHRAPSLVAVRQPGPGAATSPPSSRLRVVTAAAAEGSGPNGGASEAPPPPRRRGRPGHIALPADQAQAELEALLAREAEQENPPQAGAGLAEQRARAVRLRLPDRSTLLHAAARAGSEAGVRAVLAAGVSAQAKDRSGRTPLHVAAREGHVGAVRALLRGWASTEARDKWGDAPLHVATRAGHVGAMEALLEAGADWETGGRDGEGPLDLAVGTGPPLKALLAHVVSRTAGWNPLHAAACEGDAAEVAALLAAGAGLEARDRSGATPLAVTAFWGRPEAARALLGAGADTEAATHDGDEALRPLIDADVCIDPIMEGYFDSRGTPLHAAARDGYVGVVEALLGAGAAVDARTENGRTPLILAANEGKGEVVGALLEAGADVNAAAQNGWTPLHAAAHLDHWGLVQGLIEAGADVGAWYRLGLWKGPNRSVAALLAAGADVGAVDQAGRTPLHVAAGAGHGVIARALLRAGADPAARDKAGRTPPDCARQGAASEPWRRGRGAAEVLALLEAGAGGAGAGAGSGTAGRSS